VELLRLCSVAQQPPSFAQSSAPAIDDICG